MKKVMLYGAGHIAQKFLHYHNFEEKDETIVAFIETNITKIIFENYKVISLESLNEIPDTIYVVNQYVETVDNLIAKGIDKARIVLCSEVIKEDYLKKNKITELDLKYDEDFALLYKDKYSLKAEYVITHRMKKSVDIFECGDIKCLFGKTYVETNDYCRLGVLRLLIDEIIQNNIIGDLAELGVYRGEFSKYINRMFPDRKLYLFDTFEGFKNDELKNDFKNGYLSREWLDNSEYFKNTNVELVLNMMEYKNQCIVKKGWFPETTEGMERNQYALVSLDCDIYEPMLAGLRYFYPRLNQGGYIMVHDYNNSDRELKGVKKAVFDYENEIGHVMCKVPIPDYKGSLVITK